MTAPAARDDLARALLDARAENDRLRADAQAAVALALEQAAKIATRHWEGEPEDTLAMEAEIRALAPADGLAAVEALRKERDLAVAQNDRLWAANHNLVAEQDALTAELDAAQQREAGLLLQEVWDSDRDSDGDLCIYLDEFGDNDLLDRIEAFLATKGAESE